MRVNHSHAHAMTAEQLLNPTHIMTSFEPMGGEAMPKRLENSQLDCFDRLIKTLLIGRLMERVTSPLGRGARSSRPWRCVVERFLCAEFNAQRLGGKAILPLVGVGNQYLSRPADNFPSVANRHPRAVRQSIARALLATGRAIGGLRQR
jgi:hypothetical protein